MKSISIIIASLLLIHIEAQGLSDSTMHKILQLERRIMLQDDSGAINTLLLEKANLYKKLGNYAQVVKNLERINSQYLPEGMEESVNYELAFSYALMGNFYEAANNIGKIDSIQHKAKEYQLLNFMILIENEDWPLFNEYYSLQLKALEGDSTIVENLKAPQWTDPDHMRRLSTVPGLGLFKQGYVTKGVINIAVQASFLGFGVYNVFQGYYITALFSGVLPAYKFHVGGKQLSYALAENSYQEEVMEVKKAAYEMVYLLYH